MTAMQACDLETQPQQPASRRVGSWAGLVLVVLVLLTPFSFLIYRETSDHLAQKRANTSFSRVRAVVVESGVERRGKFKWSTELTYRYEVDGQTYPSSRLSFGRTATARLLRGGPSYEEAVETAAEHPVGSAIDAFYNPANPSEAVLDASPPSGSPLTRILLLMVVVALLAALGVGARDPGGRISFPGPRIPESVISVALFLGCIASYGVGVWFLMRAARGSAQSARDDIGTAFAFAFIGSIIGWAWRHRRPTPGDVA